MKSIPLVTQEHVTPGGRPDECVWCQQKVGLQHKYYCVAYKRKVLVKLTWKIPIEVPASWDEYGINFWLNDGSSCADNRLDDLRKMFPGELEDPCSCPCFEGKYLGEYDNEAEEA